MISVDKANDTQYLLISLIVVIIGGMGSPRRRSHRSARARTGRLLRRRLLPEGYTNYSILLIFGLLVLVLAVRPQGLFGRPG